MTHKPYTPRSRQQILNEFSDIVHDRVSLPRKIAAKQTRQPLRSSGPFVVRAQRQKEKKPSSRKIDQKPSKQPKSTKGFHNEGLLHKAIEANPLLLRTPELYVGGLYLDSIITQHGLPNRLRPDFLYLTTQGSVIKLVFVEIKSSKFSVFDESYQFKGMFHNHTLEPLKQVREYRDRLSK